MVTIGAQNLVGKSIGYITSSFIILSSPALNLFNNNGICTILGVVGA